MATRGKVFELINTKPDVTNTRPALFVKMCILELLQTQINFDNKTTNRDAKRQYHRYGDHSYRSITMLTAINWLCLAYMINREYLMIIAR